MLAANGALTQFVRAGARILESACGPCIGLGFSPAEGTVSLRTFNRNFPGRTGTPNDQVYLVSPETAVAAAIAGKVTDPRRLVELGIEYRRQPAPKKFDVDDSLLSKPMSADQAAKVQVVRGSTIVKPPPGEKLPDMLRGRVLIKVGDKITTDHIMPAGDLLKFRSNVPQYARFVFNCFTRPGEPTFAERAVAAKQAGRAGIIIAGESYGQGSSREHAALCPMYLGVRAVIAKTIERIHQANLVNFGILPLALRHPGDYDRIESDDELVIEGTAEAVASAKTVAVGNVTKGFNFICDVLLAGRQREVLAAGGLLNYTRQGASC
jgi:aconitate hydratase